MGLIFCFWRWRRSWYKFNQRHARLQSLWPSMALLTTGSCLRRTSTLSKNPPLWTSAKSCLSSFSTPVLLGPYPLFSLQYFVQVSELYVHVAFNLFTVHYYELKRFWAMCISIYVWYLILFYLFISQHSKTLWNLLEGTRLRKELMEEQKRSEGRRCWNRCFVWSWMLCLVLRRRNHRQRLHLHRLLPLKETNYYNLKQHFV